MGRRESTDRRAQGGWRTLVTEQLFRHEGVRRFPYLDTEGKITIGVGRNLTDVGLSPDEIGVLFEADLERAITTATIVATEAVFERLSDRRKAVLVNMAFNLGPRRLATFVRFFDAVAKGDYAAAASEMRRSRWATQVGQRAEELAQEMEDGS